MEKIQELLLEVKKLNERLEQLLVAQGGLKKVPKAAMDLEISPALLRKLIKDGIVPGGTSNQNPKRKHFLVNVEEAKKALESAGYLAKSIRSIQPSKSPGRKSTKTLSI